PATPPLAPLAPSIAAATTSALERACGANVDALPQAYGAMAERLVGFRPALPTPNSTDVGEIAVLEDDGTFFFTDKNGNVNLDVAAAGRAFYRTHGDDYDVVSLWLATGLSNWLGSPTALAAAWLTRNDISGIGLDPFDFNSSLGLPPHVQTVLTMNGLQRYPDDPAAEVPGLPNYVTQDVLAHEFGHHWLAYPYVFDGTGPAPLLLGRALQHWSFFFDSDGSVMEGADWQAAGPDSFVMLAPIARYGMLDQYLMGVRARGEVDSLVVISDTCRFNPPGTYVPISDPSAGIAARGPARRLAIDELEAVNGPRSPDAAQSPHHVRLAFALVVPHGSAATSADLAKLETIRAAFPSTVDQYTGGRMTLDASLDSHAGRLRLEHAGLPDTESPGVSRAVGLKVTVEQAGIPIAVRPGGVTLWWRTDPTAPWNPITMTAAATDSFAAALPGQPNGTTLQYWFHAESDSAGIFTDLPDLSASTPFSFHIGPDTRAPVIVHWPQYEQSSDRLPYPLLARVTDNLAVDAVWCEFSLDGAPVQTVPATAVGRDSFQVSLGAGAARGSRIAYRFAARDRAAAPNVGYSNPAFDTLRVGHDWVDDFWNPAPWTHGNVRFNRRDEWHPVESPAFPAGSTAWHCGLDSLPYGPYQDAALASALVYDITPGCSLTFSHRYDLEEAPGGMAFDGARVEVGLADGTWLAATPLAGYTHVIASSDQGLPQGAPCWSGRQDAWREEQIDLSPYAPGPVRVRFRMSTDLFVGRGGWWVDHVRFHFPDQGSTGVPGATAAAEFGPLWPNPASGPVSQALRLARAADVEWALYDLAGRRVATLWHGRLAAGSHELSGALPSVLADGIYFSCVGVNGRFAPARRIARLR
ncbi:MAG TPA: hypothetical protein VI504_08875, partial [Candidatus Eisenbacteria bacterium]